MAAILLAACSQDELAEQGNTLPEGEYPLQIGSVSITAESSEEPWTRVAENETDGMGSHWTDDEEFYVKFEGSDEVGIYKITDAATGAVKPVKSIYWKSTQPAKIIAWYANPQPNEANWMYFDDQDRDGLAYLLRAEQTAAYGDTPVSLQFTHQFAKLRVVTKGTAEVGQIIARDAHTWCLVQDGEITRSLGSHSYMYKTEYEGIGTCWEINAAPCDIEIFDVSPEGEPLFQRACRLDSPTTLAAGTLNVVTITAHRQGTQTIDLLNEDCIINDDGTYYFSGTASHAIRVTGGKPNIYLEDAQISVSVGNAIDITGGASPTIHVMGEGNSVSSSYGAGIYVAENSTVTITGRDRNDVLTAQAGGNAAGIGGCSNNQDCGSINISNVTVIARGSQMSAISPGIGSTSTNQCGQITIDNAIVHAYWKGASNTAECPAIGTGIATSLAYGTTLPTVIIRNGAEVHAHRGGGSADYIGYPFVLGSSTGAASAINPGAGGSITGSTVYCYTGDTLDKTVEYDASGNATQQ